MASDKHLVEGTSFLLAKPTRQGRQEVAELLVVMVVDLPTLADAAQLCVLPTQKPAIVERVFPEGLIVVSHCEVPSASQGGSPTRTGSFYDGLLDIVAHFRKTSARIAAAT